MALLDLKDDKRWEWVFKITTFVVAVLIILMIALQASMYSRISQGEREDAHITKQLEVQDAKIEENAQRIEDLQRIRIDIKGLSEQQRYANENIKEIKEILRSSYGTRNP